MARLDLAGTGALHGVLEETNRLLAAVLEELVETNSRRLELVGTELVALNERVDALLALAPADGTTDRPRHPSGTTAAQP